MTARTLRITAAIAAIFLLAGVVSVAGARDAAKTTVTIHYNGDGFQGKLKSSKAKCIQQPQGQGLQEEQRPEALHGHLGSGRPLEHREFGPDPWHVLCPHAQDPGLQGRHEQVDPHLTGAFEGTTKRDILDSQDASDHRRNRGHFLLASLVSVAGARSAAETKVTIQGGGGEYFGYVKSAKQKCKSSRKVKLYKQLGSSRTRGSDKFINSDIAQANGNGYQWNTGKHRGPPRQGLRARRQDHRLQGGQQQDDPRELVA